MSAKWRRARAWDLENLTGPLAPVRWVLTAFSSITFAIILLAFVALYGTLASIPIGLFALIPTQLFYGLTIVLTVGLFIAVPQWILSLLMPGSIGREAKFLIRFFLALLFLGVGLWIWWESVWPLIRFAPPVAATETPARGVRFFAEFVQENRSILMRQRPGWEMTELEFYGWWPLKLVLILFTLNMVVATIRRIEFRWLNVGVLTVHTGIVLIALGSIFYERGKVEGDTRLTRDGPPKGIFYDGIRPALYLTLNNRPEWYMTELQGLARYNPAPAGSPHAPRIRIHEMRRYYESFPDSLEVEIVGVVPYGEPETKLVDGGVAINPSINVSLVRGEDESARTIWEERLVGDLPGRAADAAAHLPGLTVEHLVAPDSRRVSDLATEFPREGDHLLIVRLPNFSEHGLPARANERTRGEGESADGAYGPEGHVPIDEGETTVDASASDISHGLEAHAPAQSGFKGLYVVEPGSRVAVGETGWELHVREHQSALQGLALATEGFSGARSSRLQIDGYLNGERKFTRSVLQQYPFLSQDFDRDERGELVNRRRAGRDIEITYVDASIMHFWVVQNDPLEPHFDVIQRLPGGGVQMIHLHEGEGVVGEIEDADGHIHRVRFVFDDFWPRTTQRIDIRPVPFERQERNARGTFFFGYLDVEIRVRGRDGGVHAVRRWLPFNQYLDLDYEFRRVQRVDLPGVGTLSIAFGRLQRPLPDIRLALKDFRMIPYPGTETPRDYVSDLLVIDHEGHLSENVTRLNRPFIYRRPFQWDPERNVIANTLTRVRTFLVPEQFKFSQAGWDPENQAFTVLGVGNNPGIYIIALGGILMGIGTPWAFYVKPAILRYRARKIEEQRARERKKPVEARRSEERELIGVER